MSDQLVEQDNEERMTDLFVESINLAHFKFIIKTTKEGHPAYHPKDLLKRIHFYVTLYQNHFTSRLKSLLIELYLRDNESIYTDCSYVPFDGATLQTIT